MTSTVDYVEYESSYDDLAGAWARFWARIFDIMLYSIPVSLALGLVFPQLFVGEDAVGSNLFLTSMLCLPLVMVLDALVISAFGTSIGKSIAGLNVETVNREAIDLETSFKRNSLLYIRGLVLGIPLICLIGYLSGYRAVKDDGFTSWDEDTGTRVFSTSEGSGRTWMIAMLAIFMTGAMNAISKM